MKSFGNISETKYIRELIYKNKANKGKNNWPAKRHEESFRKKLLLNERTKYIKNYSRTKIQRVEAPVKSSIVEKSMFILKPKHMRTCRRKDKNPHVLELQHYMEIS